VAHVGAANESPGSTGIAHLFEHMMFKGTQTIGTKDYQKDQQILAEQETVRDEMRTEEAKERAEYRKGDIDDLMKPENKTPRWRELNQHFNELIAAERATMVKNEFDLVYTAAGGSGMNAYTTSDYTAYFVTVPANKLELWMWMESERIFHPVFREFYSERDVVFEERRMRTESTPVGKFYEQEEAMFWESVPYSWPVLGWPSDIPSISKAQADAFYSVYYTPQNITLILVGDFDSANARELAVKYFGRIPRGKKDPPDVVTTEVKQLAEKRMYASADANPTADLNWHTVPFGHRDSYALSVLGELLASRTGRLYKGLVLGSQVATSVYAEQQSRKWAGAFTAGGDAKDGHTPEEVEQAVYAELDKLKKNEVPAEELQKIKNQYAANQFRRLSDNMAILRQMMSYDGEGDWHEINNEAAKIQAVTPADLKRVANQYFTRENSLVAIFTRKPAHAKEAQ
jgi:predicted Zn-dependent peptidase